MGVLERILFWDELARRNVNQRAADLSLGHLIHVSDRMIKLAPKAMTGTMNMALPGALTALLSAMRSGNAAAAGAVGRVAASPAYTLGLLATPSNALLLAAAGIGIDRLLGRLAARVLSPRIIAQPVSARIASLQDGRCLASVAPLRFEQCGAADTEEWRFERVAPQTALTRQAILGLVHSVDGARYFAVVDASTPRAIRICADRWCTRRLAATGRAKASWSVWSQQNDGELLTLLPPAAAGAAAILLPYSDGDATQMPKLRHLLAFVLLALVARALIRAWRRRRARQDVRTRALEHWHLPAMKGWPHELSTPAAYLEDNSMPSSRPVGRSSSYERSAGRQQLVPVHTTEPARDHLPAKESSPKHPLEVVLELAKSGVTAQARNGSSSATETLIGKELGTVAAHGELDLNNRLRAGIGELRSFAAQLKREDMEQRAARQRARAKQVASEERNSRGPEWLRAAEAMLWKDSTVEPSRPPIRSLEAAKRAAVRARRGELC